jgi:hypothetical protein
VEDLGVSTSVGSGGENNISHTFGCYDCDKEGPDEGDVYVPGVGAKVEEYVGCCVVDGYGPVMCVCSCPRIRVQ